MSCTAALAMRRTSWGRAIVGVAGHLGSSRETAVAVQWDVWCIWWFTHPAHVGMVKDKWLPSVQTGGKCSRCGAAAGTSWFISRSIEADQCPALGWKGGSACSPLCALGMFVRTLSLDRAHLTLPLFTTRSHLCKILFDFNTPAGAIDCSIRYTAV